MALPWNIEKLFTGSYVILSREERPSLTDWDTDTLVIGAMPGTPCPFLQGSPHPETTGLYCEIIARQPDWRGCPRWRLDFSGVIGGGGKDLYDLEYGYDFSERRLIAKDYDALLPNPGANGEPKFKTPWGYADEVNLTQLERSVSKTWITNVPPPSSLASLQALSPDFLATAPPNVLSWLGQAVVYNEPNGMVPRVCRWEKHPLPAVAYWKASVTWQRVEPVSIV